MNSLESILSSVAPNPRLSRLSDFCKTSSLILYGAGLTGRHILSKLKANGITPLFVVDDTPAKQGTKLDDVSIVPLTHLQTLDQPFALVVTMMNPEMNFHAVRKSLEAKGVEHVYSFIELSFLFPEELLPYFHFGQKEELLQDTNAIQSALALFTEPQSREIFLTNLNFRLNLDFGSIPVGDKDVYFPSSVMELPQRSVFFDCGAYDGDTVKSFIARNSTFDAVYAFEPDPENFNKLLRFCADLDGGTSSRIHVFNYGLSSSHRFLKFNSLNNMASSIAEEGNCIIQTLDLDGLFFPLLEDYTGDIFIKMDIEGEEPRALEGCRRLISEKQPHLAISIYHNPDDLWRIPLFIHQLHDGYKFLLRQHGNDSMDLVLYAIKERN